MPSITIYIASVGCARAPKRFHRTAYGKLGNGLVRERTLR
jgi:hypothetical protein